jgi:hypothetical protein
MSSSSLLRKSHIAHLPSQLNTVFGFTSQRSQQWYPDNHNTPWESILKNMIRHPRLIIKDRLQNYHPSCPMIGGQSRDGDLSSLNFRRWWTKIYSKTPFECEAQLLHDDYVGQDAMNDVASRLSKMKQGEIRPDSRY